MIINNEKNQSFKNALINLIKEYKTKKTSVETDNENYIIGPDDFKTLSEYEKKTIKTLGKMYNLFLKDTKNINYYDLVHVLDEISIDRTDLEKQYLLALFFPERVKHINVLYPFPVPTYPYIQKQSIRISPNAKGNFVVQAICPLLLDSSINNSSVVYVNSDASLTGMQIDNNRSHYVPLDATSCIPDAFNAYVLQCFKISVEYVGRSDIQSGFFGGSYFVSTCNSLDPDYNVSLFNYIDDSINAVKVDSRDGVNVIYYPLDSSYTHFLSVNKDNISNHNMNTSLRLAIYGSSLPPGSDTYNGSPNCINFTVCAIYNVIPTQNFSELLPVDFLVQNNKEFSLVDSAQFVNRTKLTSFPTSSVGDIERMLELPSSIKENAINELNNDIRLNGNNARYKNVLDVLKPWLSNETRSPVYIDRSLFNSFMNSQRNALPMDIDTKEENREDIE